MKQTQYKANITGAGKYLPEKILTNQDLEKIRYINKLNLNTIN